MSNANAITTDLTIEVIKKLLSLEAAGLASSILWQGEKPCSQCGSKLHSKYERNAAAWVCAGCYNEFAVEMGWEK